MSCSTSTWPEHAAPAPMPMVGYGQLRSDLARPAKRVSLPARSCPRRPARAPPHRTAAFLQRRIPCPARDSRQVGAPIAASGRCARIPERRAQSGSAPSRPSPLPPSSLTICAPATIRRAGMRTGFLRADLERAERHVCDDERLLRTARHAGGVVHHVVQRHRQRGVMPLQHHAERIADQQHVHALRFSSAAKLAS